MIRCSGCKYLEELSIKHKVFYSCQKTKNPGEWWLWQKVPKSHPRWCPRYKGEKDAEQGK